MTVLAFDGPGGGAGGRAGGDQTIPRDRWNRPLVTPPEGGKPIAFTRCTTYVDCLEDKYNLQQWQLRQVAVGLADRPDLLLSVAAHRDDKSELNRITGKAMEAARSSASSTTGTALHALCERVDRGQPLGVVPADARADIEAYQRVTAGLENVYIEQFSVLDSLKVGGTPDRVVRYDQKHYIADIKTGRDIKWGALKIAMQLAVYAHSTPYLPPGRREPYPFDIDPDYAIVIHLPAGEANCQLHFVDIRLGWDAVTTAGRVRDLRSHKGWYTPMTAAMNAAGPAPATATPRGPDGLPDNVSLAIALAKDVDELRQVWTDAVEARSWTEQHLTEALQRKEELERNTR